RQYNWSTYDLFGIQGTPVKLFISWSGALSLEFAQALRSFCKKIIQALEPWMSDADVGAGDRWNDEVSKALTEADVGLICVTRDNLDSRWLLFESGALAKSVDKARVVPILLGIAPTDLQGPLAQFQSVEASKSGIAKLFLTLHRAMDNPRITREDVVVNLEAFWPQFDKTIRRLLASGHAEAKPAPIRSDRELLEETVKILRALGEAEARRIEEKDIQSQILAATLRGEIFLAPGVTATPSEHEALRASEKDL